MNPASPGEGWHGNRVNGYVAFTDISAWSKKLSSAAAGAGIQNGMAKKSSEEYLEKLAEDVRKISDDNYSALEELRRDMLAGMGQLADSIVGGLTKPFFDSPVGTVIRGAAGAAGQTNIGTWRSNSRTFIDRAADWWYGNK